MTVKVGLILAAGMGRRLRGIIGLPGKQLIRIHGAELFLYPLLNMYIAGIRSIVIVTNPLTYDQIYRVTWELAGKLGFRFKIELNPYWDAENGNSLVIGLKTIIRKNGNTPVVLSMSDHIHHTDLFSEIIHAEDKGDIVVCADPSPINANVREATKIKGKDGIIIDIGKNIDEYCCIDTGLFIIRNPMRIVGLFHESAENLGLARIIRDERILASYHLCPTKPWKDIDVLEDLSPDHVGPLAKHILETAIPRTDT